MGARLIRDHIRLHASFYQFRKDFTTVPDEADRCVAVGLEDRNRLAALDDQRLVIAQAAEGIDDAMERLPVAGRLPGAAVDDELVGLLRVLEVVLEHPQDGLLPPALASQFRPATGLHPLHAVHDTS